MSFIGPEFRGPRKKTELGVNEEAELQTPGLRPEEKLRQAEVVLSELFPGREEQAEHVVVGLATGLPVFLKSPPGTAKTAMIDTLAKLVQGARYFRYLLTQFTEPEELLGPIDIKALREGVLRRITTGRLPEAHIVFLDEVFKASSAIRNTLLDIILNKRVPMESGYVKLDMKALYTASNELPTEEEDVAFYDRMVIRSFFTYAPEDVLEDVVRRGALFTFKGGEVVKKPVMSLEDVEAVQESVREKAVKLAQNKKFRERYVKVIAHLRRAGIEISDRRAVQTIAVVAAYSILRGRLSGAEIADALLATVPQSEEHVPVVEEELQKTGLYASKDVIEKINVLIEEIRNLLDEFGKTQSLATLSAAAKAVKELQKNIQQAERLPRTTIRQAEEVITRYKEIIDKLREESII